MKKPKIYLDTSIISHLYAPYAPDEMRDSLRLWEEIKSELYDVVVSDMVMDELSHCTEPKKRGILLTALSEISCSCVPITDEIRGFAEQAIKLGVLKEKRRDDFLHIGTAIVNGCDYIVSWDYRRIVNIKTIKSVRTVVGIDAHNIIDIIQPTMLVEKGE